ncbi:hypothetical protein [Ekhidna sp.]|uniref:hypothetical protein n=1 Tax=Ekhidna sp. TaxID=2608089 RepID=UPI003BAAAA6B
MNIEDLIKNRKDQLAIESPPKDSWDMIQKGWKKKQPGFSWWKVAAVIFISTSIGLLIHNISLQNQVETLASLGDISEEYKQIENSYITQINEIESSDEIQKARYQSDYSWIFDELKTLEEVNELYRNDIGNVDENLLVGTLIDHYEKKIRLLKKLELEIKRNNKIEENEKDNNTSVSM